ncbi:hypothetical protein [Phyllobacterium salinisoli]|uniref:hypothetical protein n=1 Tax=Phyllobacterium salinisoli TaxID=1899321 RepID=UPI0011C03A91|nr:hypothetical protein [Phyllobacterium salinisoli]
MNTFLLFISRLLARRAPRDDCTDRRHGGLHWRRLFSGRLKFFAPGLEDDGALIHISVTCRRVSSHCARQVFPSGGFAHWAPSKLEAGLLQVRLFFCLEIFRIPAASGAKNAPFMADAADDEGQSEHWQPYCTAKMECGWPIMAEKSQKTDASQHFLQCSHANLSLHLFAVRDYMLLATRTNNSSR